MALEKEPTFTKWRQRLWPVQRHEHKKIIPLFILKFLFTINFYLLGFATKDTLVVTASNSGAEVIPILKGWIVLPCSIFMLLVYTKMSNKLSQEKLFYAVLAGFLGFFLLFGFILYPLRDVLSPTGLCDWLQAALGDTRTHWVAVIRHWMNSVFYVMAELWGTMVLVLLFWTFANNINRVGEAKRFYTLFVAAGNLAPVIGGLIICSICPSDPSVNFETAMRKITLLSSVVIILAMGIYWWMQRYVITDDQLCPLDIQNEVKKKKPKLSLKDSIKYILSSRYLLCISLLVIGYAFAFNLIEVTWKASMKLQFPTASSYQHFMGKVTFILGVTTPPVAFLLSGNLIRKLGWYRSACIVPIIIGLTGILFLAAYLFRDQISPIATLFSVSPLYFVVILGMLQNVTTKTLKFSVFDPTKEMAFIPLDSEAKIKGKAAIDVVGSRLGKAGSSWTQVLLIEFFGMGSVLGITHIILPVVVLIVAVWLVSLRSLNRSFTALTTQKEEELPPVAVAEEA
ncbi:MAG: NTP/NDP exchange transporter [Chlamydiales bacterium]|nr:NTP/NDP exchange transporter [Chlamydiales bacterium]